MHEKKKSASSTSATMVSCTSPPPSQALTNDWHGRPWINSGLCRCISDLLDDYGENQVESARMHKNNDHGNTTAYLKYNAKRLIHHTNPLGDQGLLQYGTYHFHPTRGPSLPPLLHSKPTGSNDDQVSRHAQLIRPLFVTDFSWLDPIPVAGPLLTEDDHANTRTAKA